jgi:hypothetical protein
VPRKINTPESKSGVRRRRRRRRRRCEALRRC